MFACNGILFNHESPIRGETFVTRKVTRAVARIRLGLQRKLFVGNLDAKRDWGHARDFVEAQWLMLQQDRPEDFVIATGVQYSVRDLVDQAFGEIGVGLEWQGEGVSEKATVKSVSAVESLPEQDGGLRPGTTVVEIDPRYFRPTEVETLLGDSTKAREVLGWSPRITFQEMIREMVSEDLRIARRDQLCLKEGFRTYQHHE